jgi:hypothetical protein
MRNVYKILALILQGKRRVVKPRRSLENNNTVDLKQIELQCVEWIHAAQDRDYWRALINTARNV